MQSCFKQGTYKEYNTHADLKGMSALQTCYCGLELGQNLTSNSDPVVACWPMAPFTNMV